MEKILSIDAGRKYFSKEQLESIIEQACQVGFTGIEVILSNNGLRFILDDMAIHGQVQHYGSEKVKESLLKGTKKYYDDPNGCYLSQKDMDHLLQFAKKRRIELIPVINSPGHMDAIVEGMRHLGIQAPAFYTSKSTIEGDYSKFINYTNELATMVKNNKMEPIVFNDGIYYNADESYGQFDPSIIVAYWTAGWKGYEVCSPEFLVAKGHRLLNTNDSWYWVIGRHTEKDGYYHFEQVLDGIKRTDINQVSAAVEELPTIGSMFGIWADDPERPIEMQALGQLIARYSSYWHQ
ncbi:family 20 glycosylhydrolase [Enterococcus faecium]|nr:family 20 glycosylhydrolase [Enterococcus faecium]